MPSPEELKTMIDSALEGSRGPHKPTILVGDVDISSKRRAALSAVSALLGMAGDKQTHNALEVPTPSDPTPPPVPPVAAIPPEIAETVKLIGDPVEEAFKTSAIGPPPVPSVKSFGPEASKSDSWAGGTFKNKIPVPEQKVPSLKPDLVAPPKKPSVSAKQQAPAAPSAGTYETRTASINVILDKLAAYVPPPGITFPSTKEKDMELWRAYKQAPSAMTLKPLMDNLTPVIRSEVNRWSGAVPRSVLETEGKKLALEAIKTYNPNGGAALATHVMNRLRKLSRKTYMHQDLVRLPENKKLKTQTYHKGFQHLQGEFGRDPTNAELSDHLGWSRRMVSNTQRSMMGEYIESQDVGGELFSGDVTGRDSQDSILDMVYHDLNAKDKLIMEHTTGYSGKPVMTVKQLQPVVQLTPNQINYRKRKIAERLQQHMK